MADRIHHSYAKWKKCKGKHDPFQKPTAFFADINNASVETKKQTRDPLASVSLETHGDSIGQ